jgi:hypothetical protein
MMKYGVLFEVRTGFLNTVYTSLGFNGLDVGTNYQNFHADF